MKRKKIWGCRPAGAFRILSSVFPVFALALLLDCAVATAQVNVRINILPPYPAKITDYASRPQQVLLLVQNTSGAALDVQLRGTIAGDNGIVLKVDPHYKSPGPIHLNANEIRNLTGADINQLFDYNQLVFSGISKEDAIRGNGLPEGNYQVCVQAFGYYDNQPLSGDEPLGCSNVFPLNSMEPPTIISPFNEQDISAQTTQHFVITWSTPAGAPPSIQYTVRMVEILDNRNPNDAMNAAAPPLFFEQTVNSSNVLLYGPSMPAMTPGRQYALMVIAKDPFNTVIFRNQGRSEVTSFTYGAGDASSATGQGANNGNANPNIPVTTIKGKLAWYYRRSEEKAPAGVSTYSPGPSLFNSLPGSTGQGAMNAVAAQNIVASAFADPSFTAAAQPAASLLTGSIRNLSTGSANSMVSLASLKTAAPGAPVVPSTLAQLATLAPNAIGVTAAGISTIQSNDPSNFNNYGSESHPLPGTILKLMATDPSAPASPILVGAAVTDDQGNFQLSFVPPSSFSISPSTQYSFSIQSDYFSLPAVSFSIPANAVSFDAGTLNALANTYRLLAFATDPSGKELSDASISIYRLASFYNANAVLQTEGNIDENNRYPEILDGQQYIKVTQMQDGQTATRLFFSNNSNDQYRIVVTATDHSRWSSSFSAAASGSPLTAPETIHEVYQLASGPTSFSGQVYQVTGGSGLQTGIAGAVVTLYLTDSAYQRAMQVQQEIKSALNGSAAGPGAKSVTAASAGIQSATGAAASNGAGSSSGAGGVTARTGSLLKSGGASGIVSPTSVLNTITQIINGAMTVTTDSAGNFMISGIPLNPDQMKFVVNVPGSPLQKTDSILVAAPGTHIIRDISFQLQSYPVTGQVVDEKGSPIPGARYSWLSGGSYANADANGFFTTSHIAGIDSLIVMKLGYEVKRIGVNIAGGVGGPGLSGSVQRASGQGGSDKGISSQAAGAAISAAKGQPSAAVAGAQSLGKIVLRIRKGRILFQVVDAATPARPIPGATIRVEGLDSVYTTGTDGKYYFEGPGGELVADVYGASGTDYAPAQVNISTSDLDTIYEQVLLRKGVRLSGTVTAAGSAAGGANITVEGLDYVNTVSGSDGSYSLVIPQGEYTVRAAKSGFLSDSRSQTFSTAETVNFSLGTASFDITKLLGFPVQIDKIQDETGTRKLLTGTFVNIPANAVFALRPGTSIPFSNVEVDVQSGSAIPVNAVINTDLTQLSLKAFGFLPIQLTNNKGQLLIRETDPSGTAGQLEGNAAIDYGTFMPAGIAPYVSASLQQFVGNPGQAAGQSLAVLNSAGTFPTNNLSILGAANQSFNLYGFNVTLDLANSRVRADGLHLAGTIDLNSIPLVSNASFHITDLWIGANGYVNSASVSMSPAPSFQIAGWSATLNALSFNDAGFSVSGNVKVQVPSSAPSEIDFTNLSIATDQLYGGSFTIPAGGIDVFGIVKFLGGNVPLSFGKIGGSNVYYIGGSGTVHFPSLFDDITLQFFQVQTNAQFAATVQTNINRSFFDMAQVNISSVGFHTNNGVGVDVMGSFSLTGIPLIKATAGGVHFSSGGAVSVDDLGVDFNMAGIAEVKASLSFDNEPAKKGFAGQGGITIIGLPGLDIDFSYYKLPGGFSVSAMFRANIIIPVGAIVSINNPGGGFSLNTAAGTWSGTIIADASVTGLNNLVSLKNITVTVASGPVITGSVELNILTLLDIAKADLSLDFSKSLFSITISETFNPLPDVFSTEGTAIFVLSAARSDPYFMLGGYYKSSLLGIFNDDATIAAGWGLNVAAHPEYSDYTSFIDPQYLANGVLEGVSLLSMSRMGAKATGDIYIASGSIWYSNYAQVKLNLGFGAGNYAIYVGAGWDGGGSLSVALIGQIASLDIGADGDIYGSYSNGNFSVGGKLGAHLNASIGADCGDNCFTGLCTDELDIPVGGKICAHPGISIGYSSQNGFSLGLDL